MKKYLFEVPPVFPLEMHSDHLYLSYPFKKKTKTMSHCVLDSQPEDLDVLLTFSAGFLAQLWGRHCPDTAHLSGTAKASVLYTNFGCCMILLIHMHHVHIQRL